MPHSSSFKTVESIGRTLPDVEVTTTWGQPTLKVRGKMFVCIASHKSAEPNTLVVMMDFAEPRRWYEIVGVVEDFPANNDEPTMYHPMAPGQIHPVSLEQFSGARSRVDAGNGDYGGNGFTRRPSSPVQDLDVERNPNAAPVRCSAWFRLQRPPRRIACGAANSDVLIDQNRVPVWVHGNKAAGPGRILICLIH